MEDIRVTSSLIKEQRIASPEHPCHSGSLPAPGG